MSVYPLIKIEINQEDKQSYIPAEWLDISTNVDIRKPIRWDSGIYGESPLDRVASTGILSFYLENYTLKGGFSPGHDKCYLWFDINKEIRLSLQADTDDILYHQFIGKIFKISPTEGKYGEALTLVEVHDWMHDAANYNMGNVPILANKTAGQIIEAILNNSPTEPKERSITIGRNTFAYADPSGEGYRSPIIAGIKKAAMTDLGYCFLRSQASTDGDGGELVYRDRHYRVGDAEPLYIFDDNPSSSNILISELPSNRELKSIYNVIESRVVPKTIDSDITILWELEEDTPLLGSSDRLDIIGAYRSTDLAYSIVGAIDIITPVADSDYIVNSASDGSSNNMLAGLDIRELILSRDTDILGYWMLSELIGVNVREETDPSGIKDGDYEGTIQLGGRGIGDGRYAPIFDSDDYVDFDTDVLASDFSGSDGTMVAWLQLESTDAWADGNLHRICTLWAASGNYISSYIGSDANTLHFIHVGNNSISELTMNATDGLAGTTDWFHVGMTWDEAGDGIHGFYNGTDIGKTDTDLGAFTGNLTAAAFSSRSTEAERWEGKIAHLGLWYNAGFATDIQDYHNNSAPPIVTLTPEIGGTQTRFSFYNGYGYDGYLTKCQIRGKRVKGYNPVKVESRDSDSIKIYNEQYLNINLPYQDLVSEGQDVSDQILNSYKDAITIPKKMKYIANQSSDALQAAMTLRIGDAIKISESQTALDSDIFYIQYISQKLIDGRILETTYNLIPDDFCKFLVDWKQTADLEEGDLSDFDATVAATDVQVPISASTDNPASGIYGLEIHLDRGVQPSYGALQDPDVETLITYEFNICATDLTLGSDDTFIVASAYGSDGNFHTHTAIELSGSNYALQQGYRTDGASFLATSAYNLDSDHNKVKAIWGASTGNNNGYVYFYIDDILKEAIFDIDNDVANITEIRFGAEQGVDSDTLGYLYLDDIRWGTHK